MNLDLLSSLDSQIRSEFLGSGGINPDSMRIKVAINNDGRSSYSLDVDGAFVDGVAIVPRFASPIELRRRSESVITLADVSVYALMGRGNRPFAYIGELSKKDEA